VSVYDAIPGANQFSAMPSIHVAWAAAVALIVIVSARTRWRWLALGYPLATLWVTVVTGNHFTIYGVAAFVLLAVAAGVTIRFPSQRPERVLGQAAAARPAALALAPQVGAD
jgi:membrane-associated phospholipid phosphatase